MGRGGRLGVRGRLGCTGCLERPPGIALSLGNRRSGGVSPRYGGFPVCEDRRIRLGVLADRPSCPRREKSFALGPLCGKENRVRLETVQSVVAFGCAVSLALG